MLSNHLPCTFALGCGALLALFSLSSTAALQPLADAPLAQKESLSCRFNQDNSIDCNNTLEITILKPVGIQMVSKIDFTYPELDTLKVIAARVIQPDKQQIALRKKHIDTRTSPNPAHGFSRQKQTSVAFPMLKQGSILQYTIQRHFAPVPLIDGLSRFGGLSMYPSAVRYDSFQAEFIALQPIHWRAENMQEYTIQHSTDQKKLLITQQGIRYHHHVNELEWGRARIYPRLQLASAADAQSNLGQLARKHNNILQAPLPTSMTAVIQGWQNKPARERVALAMEHLASHYRYLGDWRSSGRGYIPFSLTKIAEHGYGDCKDLSTLLIATLRAMQVKAEPAWVYRGTDAPKLLLPSTAAVNHEIVRAEVDGEVWWLDPSNLVFLPGFVMPDLQERWVLVIGQDDQLRIEQIPASLPMLTKKEHNRIHFNPDGSAQIHSSVTMAGEQLMFLSQEDREHGTKVSNEHMCANFGREITDCEITRANIPFIVPSQYQIESRHRNRAEATSVAQQTFLLDHRRDKLWELLSKYLSGGDQNDLYLGGTEIHQVHTVLNQLKLTESQPSACQVRSEWFDLDIDWQQHGTVVSYDYQRRQKVRWLSHAEINSSAFKNFLDQVRTCGNTLQLLVRLNHLTT